MTDDELLRMSEADIRARYRGAPAYFLQAKLEKLRALQGRRRDDRQSESPARIRPVERRPKAAPAAPPPRKAQSRASSRSRVDVDVALPGFEILDAALAALDEPPATAPRAHSRPETPPAERTQQAIFEAALEDYSNWPLIADGRPTVEKQPKTSTPGRSDIERRLALVLEAEPDLELVLESEPDLESPAIAAVPENVTVGAFGGGARDKVRVVSVVMDRKRPYMVRVIGATTRRAS